jgi:predicted dehydrogenase
MKFPPRSRIMLSRRQLLASGAIAFAGAQLRAAEGPRLGAAVIGHTGRGDFGHGLDTALAGRNNIEVIAVADAADNARDRALVRTGAKRFYGDYREMLDKERPDLVVVGPRITPERRDMLLAALNAGAHVLCEKPFVRAPADGDEVLALADRKSLKIAVAHQMRLAHCVVHLKNRIAAGLIGDLVEMRAFGKQDQRAGGEDLLVLGVHLFDLMRRFAGDPRVCHGAVLAKGRPATRDDAHPATEDIGPVLGDQVSAHFTFDNGVIGHFTSDARLREQAGHWGIELVGTKASARILADIWPRLFVKSIAKWDDAGRPDQWRPLDDDPALKIPAAARTTAAANALVVDDWLAAVGEDRDAACSGRSAAWAVEMVHAVWRAGLSGARVKLPLGERGHALA